MLSGVEDAAAAAIAADRVMRAMSAEFVVHGHSLSITCSIGISIFPEHGADAETLIKNADGAMHLAKDGGRNLVRFFTNEMNGQAAERLTLENGLRGALDRSEFFLVYQPQIEISTGRITGLEALIRWEHPELGLVPPDRFIPIAEDTGMILQIGEWVLKTACGRRKRGKMMGFGLYLWPSMCRQSSFARKTSARSSAAFCRRPGSLRITSNWSLRKAFSYRMWI